MRFHFLLTGMPGFSTLDNIRAFGVRACARLFRLVCWLRGSGFLALRQLIQPGELGLVQVGLELSVRLEEQIDRLDVASRHLLFVVHACLADGDGETAPTSERDTLSAQKATQQHLAQLAKRHFRL